MQVTREYADKHLNTNERWMIFFPNKKEWQRSSRNFWKYTQGEVLPKYGDMHVSYYQTDELRNHYHFLNDKMITVHITEQL